MIFLDWLHRETYEAPATVMLGPIASAILAGFAVLIGNQVCLTPAGERYLADIDSAQEAAA